MKTFVHLDQNILSDLRNRRQIQFPDKALASLKSSCMNTSVRVVYSFVHLQEIWQITNLDYQQEHIALLKEINAIYILPISAELCYSEPKVIWQDFLENIKDNEESGINKVGEIQDLINRKLLGLPIEMSFCELEDELKEALTRMILDKIEALSNLNPNKYSLNLN